MHLSHVFLMYDKTTIPNKMIQEYGFARFMTQEEACRAGDMLGVYPDIRLGDQYCFGVMETEEATETEEYIDIINKLSTVHEIEEVYLYYKQPYPTGNPMNYYVGTDTPLEGMAEDEPYILFSCTTVSKEDLGEGTLTYATDRRHEAAEFKN